MANDDRESTLTFEFPNGIKVSVTYPFWMRAIEVGMQVPGLLELSGATKKVTLNGKPLENTAK